MIVAFTGRALALAALSLVALGAPAHAQPPPANADDHAVGRFGSKNVKPPYLGQISAQSYDGVSDDLLTAGLGKTGLAAAAPAFANPLASTATELRRNAIHANYRAVLDITEAGGYGTLYGPNVTNAGVVTASEGKIQGNRAMR